MKEEADSCCSRMKQVLDVSTNRNIAGVSREYGLVFPVTIFESTVMYMVQQNR
ncbi:MAG: hypothetical protein K2O18_10540 [Oscillospiraceae bacterium]|nr:hypothetical protein [Oscillospiraceae bacterium]